MTEKVKLDFSVDEGLLKYLESQFPVRPPDPNHSDREIWMKAGEWRLLAYLRVLQGRINKQNFPTA